VPWLIGLVLAAHLCAAQDPLPRAIDSLESVLKTQVRDSNRVNTLCRLGLKLRYSGELDSALACEQEAYQLASSLSFRRGMILSLSHTGLIQSDKGNYSAALANYKKVIGMYEENGDKYGMASMLGNMGIVYRNQGDLPKALDYNLQALKLDEETKNPEGIAARTGNLGLIYWNLREFDNSLRYTERTLELARQMGNKRMEATALGNIGNVYYDKGDLGKTLEYYFKALETDEGSGNKTGVARHLGNISVVYTDLAGDCTRVQEKDRLLKKAYDFALRSLRQEEENGNQEGIAAGESNIGLIFLNLKNYAEALHHLEHSLAVAEEVGNMEDLETVHELLARLWEEKGDFRTAFTHYKRYIAYRDSLINEENTRKTVQSQMQYDFDRQQAADSVKNAEQLKQEELKHEQQIAQQRIYTYGGALGFLLMLVVAGVSFRAYRQKQRANTVITQQKILVEEKQKEILDSIHYAKRIQQSLLPSEKYMEKHLDRRVRG
jgi:tetratricopeptide (TPR) repeat protein